LKFGLLLSRVRFLVAGQWFSPGSPVSSTNNTDRHGKTEIFLKVVLNTKNLTLERRRPNFK
jgi:hypothetical protein